jgi:hypothetical protein
VKLQEDRKRLLSWTLIDSRRWTLISTCQTFWCDEILMVRCCQLLEGLFGFVLLVERRLHGQDGEFVKTMLF